MKKNYQFLAVLLLVVFFISGCSPKDSTQADNSPQEQSTEDETQKIVDNFKNKYSAVELYNEYENVNFSAEIVDKSKGKNIYSPLCWIDDIFYSGNDLYMCAELFGDSSGLFKITQEQYSAILSMYDDDSIDLHVVFTLDNIETMLPTLSANFDFYISSPDDTSTDEETSVYFDSRIIHGTLVDIINVH